MDPLAGSRTFRHIQANIPAMSESAGQRKGKAMKKAFRNSGTIATWTLGPLVAVLGLAMLGCVFILLSAHDALENTNERAAQWISRTVKSSLTVLFLAIPVLFVGMMLGDPNSGLSPMGAIGLGLVFGLSAAIMVAWVAAWLAAIGVMLSWLGRRITRRMGVLA